MVIPARSIRTLLARSWLPVFAAGMVLLATGLWIHRLVRSDPDAPLTEAELSYSTHVISALDLLAQHLETLHPLLVEPHLDSPAWCDAVEQHADDISEAAGTLASLEAAGRYAPAQEKIAEAAGIYLRAMYLLREATERQDRAALDRALEEMIHGSIMLGKARALTK